MNTNYLLNSLQDYALFILHLLVILQRLFTLHLLTKLQSKIEVSISIGFVFFEILYFLTILSSLLIIFTPKSFSNFYTVKFLSQGYFFIFKKSLNLSDLTTPFIISSI